MRSPCANVCLQSGSGQNGIGFPMGSNSVEQVEVALFGGKMRPSEAAPDIVHRARMVMMSGTSATACITCLQSNR